MVQEDKDGMRKESEIEPLPANLANYVFVLGPQDCTCLPARLPACLIQTRLTGRAILLLILSVLLIIVMAVANKRTYCNLVDGMFVEWYVFPTSQYLQSPTDYHLVTVGRCVNLAPGRPQPIRPSAQPHQNVPKGPLGGWVGGGIRRWRGGVGGENGNGQSNGNSCYTPRVP